jgi:hypothetical protein
MVERTLQSVWIQLRLDLLTGGEATADPARPMVGANLGK